ncbi:MAG: hypothetical protein PHW96_03635 [Candidatus Nanoarchaeia archaeon]|nr:hypothetical protein [Candidatus Nanoarchaeia archaeon]
MDNTTPNPFQKILLVLIAIVSAFGIGLIYYSMQTNIEQTWTAITAMFTWLGVIILMVISGQIEDIRKKPKK